MRLVKIHVWGSRIVDRGATAFLMWGPMISGSRRIVFAIREVEEPEAFSGLTDMAHLLSSRPMR